MSAHSLISYSKDMCVTGLLRRQIFTTPLSSEVLALGSDGYIFFIVKDNSGTAGALWSWMLVGFCPHLSPWWQAEFVSPAQYIAPETHTSAHAQALSFGFLSETRLKSMWEFALWEGCRGHTVQNAHQAFLLITVQCVLRIQTGRSCIFAVIS